MATMDLRLVVGGLLTRNGVLSTLLMNYADRLEQGRFGRDTATAPCFIVPTWSIDARPSAPLRSQWLTVEAHTSRNDPSRHHNLDTILRLLHGVLTDDHAGRLITARRLSTSAVLMTRGLDTDFRVGTWEITPVPSCDLESAQTRLLPWPDSTTSVITAGALASGTVSLN
jgi:hypothetical protein